MSQKELSRLEVMHQLKEKRLNQSRAAEMLGISIRQVKRLFAAYKSNGAEGLISKRRGKPSNNKLPENVKELALALVREHYYDFGPKFAQEKLFERHDLNVSVSTLRTWMIESNIWIPRSQRLKRPHQPRYRRPCYGELIQIDGSDHDWFEGKSPKCTLLVYIDDATSKLMAMRFVSSESTFTYFDLTKNYVLKHGKPIAFYSDKYSVFRVNRKDAKAGDQITQFGRALYDLNIDIINANTCEAKGRVERANKTLQDRLIKEMRLRGITSPEEGNRYIPEFIEDFNKRFGKEPANNKDLHRPLNFHERAHIEDVFCWQEERTFSYFEATKAYIRKHGKPVTFYSDKHGVFRVNAKDPKEGDEVTQFGRALLDLNIDMINAHSSEAKGRVERANRTLQDRLIKEMRLLNISNAEAGNAYLPQFIEEYNRKFAKSPAMDADIHRSLQVHEINALDDIFSWHEDRTLSNNLTLQYDKVKYIIEDTEENRQLRRKRVTVMDFADGRIKIAHAGRALNYHKFDKLRRVNPGAIVQNERLGTVLAYIKEQQDLTEQEERSKSCPRRYDFKVNTA